MRQRRRGVRTAAVHAMRCTRENHAHCGRKPIHAVNWLDGRLSRVGTVEAAQLARRPDDSQSSFCTCHELRPNSGSIMTSATHHELNHRLHADLRPAQGRPSFIGRPELPEQHGGPDGGKPGGRAAGSESELLTATASARQAPTGLIVDEGASCTKHISFPV